MTTPHSSPDSAFTRTTERWQRFQGMHEQPECMLMVRFSSDPAPPFPHPDNVGERIEYWWHHYLRQRERAQWLDDDTVPCLNVQTGTEIFAEAFGCPVHRPDNDMPFAVPMITDSSQVGGIATPGLDSPPLARLFRMADELRRRAGDEAIMKLVDIQSPMDIAALIWEKAQFYVGMLIAPEAVAELAGKTSRLLTAFLDEWFARYGHRFVAHYPDYFMDGGITLSEDEIGSVSSDDFDRFFKPELVALSERYGGIGIHCCANARHQWNGLASIPGLKMLNLVHNREMLTEAYQWFAPKVAQMHSWCGDGTVEERLSRLPAGARAVLEVTVDNDEEAEEAVRRFRGALETYGVGRERAIGRRASSTLRENP